MKRERNSGDGHADGLPPFPLTKQEWQRACDRLQLTKQQAKVAELVLRAAGDKKVAYELGLGLPTVRTHLHRIYEKVGVQDRAGLIVRIINMARVNET
jgi:DNA-binding NarL/FixJ family response regulator